MKNKIVAVVLGWFACAASLSAADLTLWYQQPVGGVVNEPLTSHQGQPAVGMGGGKSSHAMNEALPIGNGRMGALIFGAPGRERISVNESSLWTGGENPTGDYNSMGAYQVLGNVFVNLPREGAVTDYRRDLDLANALSHVSYKFNGVKFQREFFAVIRQKCSWRNLRLIKNRLTPEALSWLIRITQKLSPKAIASRPPARWITA